MLEVQNSEFYGSLSWNAVAILEETREAEVDMDVVEEAAEVDMDAVEEAAEVDMDAVEEEDTMQDMKEMIIMEVDTTAGEQVDLILVEEVEEVVEEVVADLIMLEMMVGNFYKQENKQY